MHTRIIGLCGPAGSGKTLAAQYIEEEFGLGRMSFAEPIKRMLRDGLGLRRAQLFGAEKETPIEEFGGITPRELMRSLGDWGRMQRADLWIALLDQAAERAAMYHGRIALSTGGPLGIVIDDVRLESEAAWVRSKAGLLLHLDRQGKFADLTHITESGIDHHDGDLLIRNYGIDDALRRQIIDVVGHWLGTREQ